MKTQAVKMDKNRLIVHQKARKIMNMQDKSFAFRLAALLASDTNPGKVMV